MKPVFLFIALTMQIFGAIIAYRGLSQGWREVRHDESFAGPLQRKISKARSAITRRWNRLLRRNKVQVRSARASGTAGSVTLSVSATGGKTSNGAIERDVDMRDAIDILNERINETLGKIVAVDTRLDRETRQLRGRVSDIDKNLGQAIEDHAEDQRVRSVRALRIEIVGFTLLTLGSLIGGVVSLVSP